MKKGNLKRGAKDRGNKGEDEGQDIRGVKDRIRGGKDTPTLTSVKGYKRFQQFCSWG